MRDTQLTLAYSIFATPCSTSELQPLPAPVGIGMKGQRTDGTGKVLEYKKSVQSNGNASMGLWGCFF